MTVTTKIHHNCTIQRTFLVQKGFLNLVTGKMESDGEPILTTGPCDAPLFEDYEKQTGVCKSCNRGWEHERNKFATEEEYMRAGQAY